jgi:hypothetical protein
VAMRQHRASPKNPPKTAVGRQMGFHGVAHGCCDHLGRQLANDMSAATPEPSRRMAVAAKPWIGCGLDWKLCAMATDCRCRGYCLSSGEMFCTGRAWLPGSCQYRRPRPDG